jgi:NADPH-dependent 2,4-dienoyl-CoA reductase/sulfur reductase-like enzyme
MTKIVVIGGGPAAVWAAIEAKKTNSSATVTLITDEACEPYEKPPLSKAVLLGKSKPEDAPIAGLGGLRKHGVLLRLNTRCTAIDRGSRQCVTTGGSLAYDALVIATGSVMRELPLFPIGMPRVHYLRTEAHARAIQAQLSAGNRLALIGAGLIGLEAAASAVTLGLDVRVFEAAPRIMSRACDEETGNRILAEHCARGVKFEMPTIVSSVASQPDGSIVLETNDGAWHACDFVLVGAGVIPNDTLAVMTSPKEWFVWRTGTMPSNRVPSRAETRPEAMKATQRRRRFGASSTICLFKGSVGRIQKRSGCGEHCQTRAPFCLRRRRASSHMH